MSKSTTNENDTPDKPDSAPRLLGKWGSVLI
jgi:hypothetical protein